MNRIDKAKVAYIKFKKVLRWADQHYDQAKGKVNAFCKKYANPLDIAYNNLTNAEKQMFEEWRKTIKI